MKGFPSIKDPFNKENTLAWVEQLDWKKLLFSMLLLYNYATMSISSSKKRLAYLIFLLSIYVKGYAREAWPTGHIAVNHITLVTWLNYVVSYIRISLSK